MRALTPAMERAIVRDYVCTGLSLPEIAAKYGISVARLTSIRKRHGVHRYTTRKMIAAAGASAGKNEPKPKLRRCPICNGTEDLSAPHQHGAAA